MRTTFVLLMTAAGCAGGFAAGFLLRAAPSQGPSHVLTADGSGADRQMVQGDAQLAQPGGGARTDLGEAAEDPVPTKREPVRKSAAAPMFSQTLLAHHASEFDIGWGSVRAEVAPASAKQAGELDFRTEVLTASRRLGARAAEGLTKELAAAVAVTDASGAGLLLALGEGAWTPPEGFVREASFTKVTTARGGGGAVDGEALTSGGADKVSDGAVISFGPGVFKLTDRQLYGADGRTVPKDVTVIGAGRDSTLLQFGNAGGFGDIERLTFRNVTLDAENDGLFDHRRGSLSLHLESSRVVRFDAAHGGCTIFSVRGGTAVTAVGTDFMGGYGRNPGAGSFLRGEPFLGYFKNCGIELVGMGDVGGLDAGQVHFEGCRFKLQGGDPRTWENARVTLAGCTFEAIERRASGLQKNLSDLFPQLR